MSAGPGNDAAVQVGQGAAVRRGCHGKPRQPHGQPGGGDGRARAGQGGRAPHQARREPGGGRDGRGRPAQPRGLREVYIHACPAAAPERSHCSYGSRHYSHVGDI
eukprot:scaffold280724_cov38-Prasinocladus_malaysianus.AAC.2